MVVWVVLVFLLLEKLLVELADGHVLLEVLLEELEPEDVLTQLEPDDVGKELFEVLGGQAGLTLSMVTM